MKNFAETLYETCAKKCEGYPNSDCDCSHAYNSELSKASSQTDFFLINELIGERNTWRSKYEATNNVYNELRKNADLVFNSLRLEINKLKARNEVLDGRLKEKNNQLHASFQSALNENEKLKKENEGYLKILRDVIRVLPLLPLPEWHPLYERIKSIFTVNEKD